MGSGCPLAARPLTGGNPRIDATDQLGERPHLIDIDPADNVGRQSEVCPRRFDMTTFVALIVIIAAVGGIAAIVLRRSQRS
jgi:hypothetical protein